MIITLPTSFEDPFLERLAELNDRNAARGLRVAELFGSIPTSILGSGRPPRSLPTVSRKSLESHVARARELGFAFSYTVNSSCTANRENDPLERRRMLDELLWIRDIGCHAIVVASPYLLDLAARHVADLRIHVSSIAFVKSTKEALHYQRRGAKRLVLDPDLTRDFDFIEKLRGGCPEIELEVLANHPCLLNCPYETYCYNSVSHASAGDGPGYRGYALLSCNRDKLRDPAEMIKGSWFRPQDSIHYERAGVEVLKIAGRGRSSEWLLATAEAYLSREYHGDMLQLIWDAQWTAVNRWVDDGKLPLVPARIPADSLDGFMEFFVKHNPRCRDGCGSCRHCDSIAERALQIDARSIDESLERIEGALEGQTGVEACPQS
jgi:collagenase-like PrtC family protease